MSLRRMYVAQALAPGAELRLGEEAARYLGRVLRLHHGEMIHVFNGDDGEWSAEMRRLGKSEVSLVVHDRVERHSESGLKVHLVQGIPRGERMDFVVQKATELGVKRITPVLTDFGVIKLDDKRAAKRRDHWQRAGAGESLGTLGEPQTKLCLLVGPEGGFSDREYADADTAGFKAVTIGPRILRTETAAVAAIAIAQSRWGDLK